MSDITLSKAVRSNLLNLQSTAVQLGKTQERLSTGLRVNSALDNPTNFFTASSLNSRASDLSQLLDSVSNAVQTVSAADKGISAITKLVETAQATARQALQTAVTVEDQPAKAGTITASQASVATAGGTLTINGRSYTVANTDDATAVKALIDADTSADFTATVGTGADAGKLIITGKTATTDVNITATVAGLGLATGNNAATAATTKANPKREELATQYNDLLIQIDQLAKDAGFNGVNLLTSDSLEVTFNEEGTSKLNVTGVDFDAQGLGLTSLASTGFDTNDGINDTLDDLKAATETLRTQAAKFGSNLSVVETRQDFTKNMINVLQTGAANLTIADTNEEAANLLALQTRQQLSSTALSLASQADQNVLRLF